MDRGSRRWTAETPWRSIGLRLAACLIALVAFGPATVTSVAHGQPAETAAPVVEAPAAPAPTAAPAPAPTVEPKSTAQPKASGPAQRLAPSVGRATPRQTVTGFLRSVEQGQIDQAVQYLDLRGMRWGELTPAKAAEQLAAVMKKRLVIRPEALSDLPDGHEADGLEVEQLGTVDVDGEGVGITLTRTPGPGGQSVWQFSQDTVARIPDLYRAHQAGGGLDDYIPPSLKKPWLGGLLVWQWLGLLLAVVVAYPIGLLLGTLVVLLLRQLTARTRVAWDDAIVDRGRGPFRFALGWLSLGGFIRALDLPVSFLDSLRVLYATPLIIATGWFLICAVSAVTHVLGDASPEDTKAEHKSRGLRTQLVLVRKLGHILIGFVTFSIVLLQFEIVQSVGVSLLASAGVAGVALGFAAQKSLGAVIAGIQLSISQPIRIGDAIVVNGEWGEVEEIALTYVQVKVWDERRLIVPIEVFLTTIFENWSKPGTQLIGIVEIAVDPTTPIEALRDHFFALAKKHPTYDGRILLLQVIDVDERRALVRARASTSRPDEAFQMRCDFREGLMAFLQQWEGGRYLPKRRLEMTAGPDRAEPSGERRPSGSRPRQSEPG